MEIYASESFIVFRKVKNEAIEGQPQPLQHVNWLQCSNIKSALECHQTSENNANKQEYHQKQIRSMVLNCNRCDTPNDSIHTNSSSSSETQTLSNKNKAKINSNENDETNNSNVIFKSTRDIGTMGAGCKGSLRISIFQVFNNADCTPQSAIGAPIAILTDHLPSVHAKYHELNENNRYTAQLPEIIKQKGREYFELPISPRDWRALMKHYCRSKLKSDMQTRYGWCPSDQVLCFICCSTYQNCTMICLCMYNHIGCSVFTIR